MTATALQPGTRGNPNAKILVVAESYGADEERLQQPLVGASGRELESIMRQAKLDPNDCYYTNIVNARPANNEMHRFFLSTEEAKSKSLPAIRGLYPDIKVLEGIARLEQLIEKLQPKLIIGFGNYALWGLTEQNFRIANGSDTAKGYKIPTGITDYRGSQLVSRFGDIPFLPTYHPAAALRQRPWRNLIVHDLRMRVPKALSGNPLDWVEPYREYILGPTFDQVMEVLVGLRLRAEMNETPLLVSCDIETLEHFVECIGLAWSSTNALCIPIMCSHDREGYWSAQEEASVFIELKRLLEHPNVEVVGQNFFYDFQYFWYYHHQRPRYRHDTMLAHHVCYPGHDAGLNYLSSLYAEWHAYWKDDGKEATKNQNDFERWTYNCRDCVITYEIIETLWKVIQYHGLEWQYAFQMKRANSAVAMMLRGVNINKQLRAEEHVKFLETSMEMKNDLEYILPESVYERPPAKAKKSEWFNSNQQLAHVLYDRLGLPEVRNRDTGNRTVDDDALTKLGAREPMLRPFFNKIKQYRSLQTSAQYIEMKLAPDGRVRCSFSPNTETFRYRSHASALGYGRNLQNIPKGAEDDD